jgi:transposase
MRAVQTADAVVTLKNGRTRRFRSKLERRQIVEETMKPGASVSLVARAHDVNTNQVFKWRRQYHAGKLEVQQASGALLPVRISDSAPKLQVQPASRGKSRARKTGIIDIDLGHARIRIEGSADPDCVRAAIEGLAR